MNPSGHGIDVDEQADTDPETDDGIDVDAVLAGVGHGPAHHHRPSGLVGRISLGLVETSMRWPKRVVALAGVITVVLLAMFVRVQVDTDPESMLSADAPVRVLNEEIRTTFGTRDMVVVGLFSDQSLVTASDIDAAVAFHDAISAIDGVAEDTMISVRTAIPDAGPETDAAAQAIADQIAVDPLLAGNVFSADGDTFAFFVPLDDKSDAVPVSDEIDRLLDESPELAALERHVAGLPLAQEAFGDQMFVQMAVFAPMAGVAIFALMLVFFRRVVLVGPAMLLALLSVIWAMGLLIGTGNTLAHHEFDDPDLPDADRHPRCDPRHQRVLRPVRATSRSSSRAAHRLRRTCRTDRVHDADHRRRLRCAGAHADPTRFGCSGSSWRSVLPLRGSARSRSCRQCSCW